MMLTYLGIAVTRGGPTWLRRSNRGRNFLSCLVVLGVLFSLYSFVGSSTAQAQEAFTFIAVADARVLEANPTINYGTLSRLDVDSPGQESYIRFNVTGVTGTVQSATLRLFVTNGSSNGPSLYLTNNTWTETGITWNNRPAPTSGAVANVAAVTASAWAEYNVTAQITGDGTYSFVLLPDSTDGVTFYSREGSSPPQLVLTLSSGPTSTPTNTPSPTATLTNTPTNTPTNTATIGPSPTASNTATNTPVPPSPTNTPTPTRTSTPTNTPVSTGLTLSAVADARVLQTNPNTNYGNLNRLDVDSPGQESYIRFTVSGVTGAVQSAMLRLFMTNGSSNGPSLYLTNNTWTETGITWNNRPAPTSGVVANVGAASANTWAEYNVTAQITGNGTYSFVLLPDSTDGITLTSREGSSPPQLVLTFTSGPTPTPTNTPLPTATNTPTTTATNTPLPTATPTFTSTATPLPTATPTNTPTIDPSSTPSNTPTATNTATNTPVLPTPTNTSTPTSTSTSTNTPAVTPTPTNTPISGVVTLAAVADARVLAINPDINYGTLPQLDIDDPGEQSYIRFTVSGLTSPVQSATLRLFVTNGSTNGPSIYGTDNNWTESGITWNNRPAATTGVIANLGTAAASTWAEYTLTNYITGNGTYSFVLLPDSSDGIRFDSREGSSSPQLVLSFAYGSVDTPTPGPSPTPTDTPTPTNTPSSESVVFVGAGDIADCSGNDEATALLLDNIPGTVYTVGDNAYPNGTVAQFNDCYDPTWGRHKARTHPAVGDNDYNTSGATPYYNYFGVAAGDPTKGYYSYNLGNWHIIVLNSNCSAIGGCGSNSTQGQWLQADLAANPSICTLAIHHEPLFSSKGGDVDLRDLWVSLYNAGAEIVLSGHRHMYERFAQQNPDGVADPERGIRQFVVGTGGASLTSSPSSFAPNSQVRNNNTYGVLKLTLHSTSYDWQFMPVAGQTFSDSGSTQCATP